MAAPVGLNATRRCCSCATDLMSAGSSDPIDHQGFSASVSRPVVRTQRSLKNRFVVKAVPPQ